MLRNVVAIVSGGSSGLGAATASYIVHSGGRVLIADLPSSKEHYLRLAAVTCAEVHHDKAEEDKHDINFKPASSSAASAAASSTVVTSLDDDHRHRPIMAFAETDVTNENDVIKALDFAQETFGQPINVAVSCAGIGIARKTISSSSKKNHDDDDDNNHNTSVNIHSLDEFNKALQVNTLGTFNLARLSAERMVQRKPDKDGLRGCIINTASIAAFEGQTGQVAYAASKGAVVGTYTLIVRMYIHLYLYIYIYIYIRIIIYSVDIFKIYIMYT